MVTRDNVFFVAHLSNRALPPLGDIAPAEGLVHVERRRLLCGERVFEWVRIRNYGSDELVLPLRFELGADFRDMFEVRGNVRPARGEQLPTRTGAHDVEFGYRGLDDVVRRSVVAFSRRLAPVEIGRASCRERVCQYV